MTTTSRYIDQSLKIFIQRKKFLGEMVHSQSGGGNVLKDKDALKGYWVTSKATGANIKGLFLTKDGTIQRLRNKTID